MISGLSTLSDNCQLKLSQQLLRMFCCFL